MSRARLTLRLAGRDLQRRGIETMLLFAALMISAAALTIGLVLHGQTATPYAATRASTHGPDVIAAIISDAGHVANPQQLERLTALTADHGVVAHTGPLPVTWSPMRVHGLTAVAEVQGRTAGPSAVDRPQVVNGTWVRRGGVVVERAFAQALGVSVGDVVWIGGHPAPVVGIAVTAALPSYPQLCTIGCVLAHPGWREAQPGLVWASRSQAIRLATSREPVAWFLYLRLASPASAPMFADRATQALPVGATVVGWQEVEARHAELLGHERALVVFGSSLLILLALATVVTLVGGRMTEEPRRVGTLKAIGASPGYIAWVLLASYLAVGLVSAAAGLLLGRILTPSLASAGAGLLGAAGSTRLTATDAGWVIGTMLGVVALASVVPALRAARITTVRALADAGRTPRRSRLLGAIAFRLPAPALIGLRLAGRRPRRAVLTAASIAVAVCGGVVVLYAQASLVAEHGPSGGPADPNAAQLHTVMVGLTVLLASMAALIVLFVARTSAVDARETLATTRALGATPGQTTTALGLAQICPALIGIALGMGAGVELFRGLAVSHPASPPSWALAGLVLVTLGAVLALTALPSLVEARRPIAAVLRQP